MSTLPTSRADVATAAVAPPQALVATQPLAERLAALDASLVERAASDPGAVRREARRLRREGTLLRPAEPAAIVYRLSVAGHRQTGVVVDVALDAYRDGRILPHEQTRGERVQQLSAFLEAAQCELVPVMLTHAPRPSLRTQLAEIAACEPHLYLAADGVEQTVWVAPMQPGLREELAALSTLYVADGHHRMAAAHAYAAQHAAEPTSAHVLGALFPADEMRLLGYHRAVRVRTDVEELARQPGVLSLDEASDRPAGPGTVSVWLDGRWFHLRLRPTGTLDLVALEDGVLAPLLDCLDPQADDRVTPLPGTFNSAALAAWCAAHDAVGFLLHPPAVDQVLAAADARQALPPKSTWFDPKSRPGPFLRPLHG